LTSDGGRRVVQTKVEKSMAVPGPCKNMYSTSSDVEFVAQQLVSVVSVCFRNEDVPVWLYLTPVLF